MQNQLHTWAAIAIPLRAVALTADVVAERFSATGRHRLSATLRWAGNAAELMATVIETITTGS